MKLLTAGLLVAMASQGPTTPKDFERAIGVPIDDFEAVWKEWVLELDPD